MFTARNITPPDNLFKELEEMQPFLESNYDSDNPAACVDRGNELQIIIARTGKMLADAKYWQDQFVNSAITETIAEALGKEKVWSTTTINKKIESLCKDYNYLVKWCERSNRTASHQLDFVRTIISKLKAEMQMNGYGK